MSSAIVTCARCTMIPKISSTCLTTWTATSTICATAMSPMVIRVPGIFTGMRLTRYAPLPPRPTAWTTKSPVNLTVCTTCPILASATSTTSVCAANPSPPPVPGNCSSTPSPCSAITRALLLAMPAPLPSKFSSDSL